MANEYAVNSADLIAVADAIRAKSGMTEPLIFPSEMVNVIETLSTGVELNFEVVGGTTKPTSPKEVTVWVNTDTQITGWAFSPDEPTNLVGGMVWFKTGTSDTISFNALKKNEIDMRPSGAYQYISSEWVKKEMLVYYGGKWVSGAVYLYDNGTFYDGMSITYIDMGWPAEGLTVETDHFNVKVGLGGYYYLGFDKPCDLTDISTVRVKMFSKTTYNSNGSADWQAAFRVVAATALSGGSWPAWVQQQSVSGGTTYTVDLDVSGLEGNFYILLLYKAADDGSGSVDINVQEVQLLV